MSKSTKKNNEEKLTSLSDEAIRQSNKIIKNILSGIRIGWEENFDEKLAETYYSRGYIEYQNGRYDDASKTFAYILLNDPANVRAMRGCASSMQMQGKYEYAMHLLAIAAAADDDNSDVALQIVECLLKLNRKNDALILLSELEKSKYSEKEDDYVQRKMVAIREFLGPNP